MAHFSLRISQNCVSLIVILMGILLFSCVPITRPPSADRPASSDEPQGTDMPEATEGALPDGDLPAGPGGVVGKIEPELLDELSMECEGCDHRVVVLLKEPKAMQKIREAADIFGQGSPAVLALIHSLRQEIAAQQRRILEEVNGVGDAAVERFQVDYQFAAVPALIGITTEEVVDIMKGLDDVERMGVDVIGEGGAEGFDGVARIGATAFHTNGFMGAGVTIAVLDSGFDPNAPDLQNTVTHQACFLDFNKAHNGKGKCANRERRQFGDGAAVDKHGHGTFVTGILTSDGNHSPMGVAPAANIVELRVLDADRRFFDFAEIVAALDYVITQTQEGGIHVNLINMSVGSDKPFPHNCDHEQRGYLDIAKAAIETLREMGITIFAASGNKPQHDQMDAPACISFVVSVGATGPDGQMAEFSNRSPQLDLVAPGVSIESIEFVSLTGPQQGTSFATPYVVGCAALLMAAGMATTPDEIETKLKDLAIPVPLPDGGFVPGLHCSLE